MTSIHSGEAIHHKGKKKMMKRDNQAFFRRCVVRRIIMKRCKGILALLLSVMITLTFTPSIAFAGSGDVGDPDSGVVAG